MANSCDWRAETINDLLNRACDDALEVIFGNGLFGDESDVLAALIGRVLRPRTTVWQQPG